ncbi:MAG: GAF domain-containing protein, partial [Bacteroidales bacterium]|nr:GAF domain-containing protein [Bacteroidales bacterium]
MAPLILASLTYWFQHKHNEEIKQCETELEERESRIDKNAQLAKKIGEGNYDIDIKLTDKDDVLGRSLLVMRENLLANKKKESDQSWIAEGKDIISNILRLHNNIDDLSYDVIVNLIKYINSIQGALYVYDEDNKVLKNIATYAYNRKKYINQEFKVGYGLIGQCAYEMDIIYRTEIPDDYVTITSGILGDQKPKSILIVPLISDEKLQGVIEFATLEEVFSDLTIRYLKELGEIIARTLFNLKVNHRTEKLLAESQKMTEELRENEEQLRQNAEEMRATQEELEKSNEKLEAQIQQVENAQKRLYSLLENASEIITIYDSYKKMTYCSPSVINILGFTPEEMMGGKDIDRLTRRGEAMFSEMFQQLLNEPGQPVSIQYTYMKKDGDKIFIEATGRKPSKRLS